MGVEITLHVFGEELFAREIMRVEDRGDNMEPVLRIIGRKWLTWNAEQFLSEGRRASGGWDDLLPATVRKRGSAHPILRDEGDLFDDLTSAESLDIGDDFLHLSVSEDVDEYGGFLQTGTKHMVRRRPLEFTEADRVEMMRDLQRYLITGMVA